MIQYNFKDDYSEGAHPNLLQALMETNLNQQFYGYGKDRYCNKAIKIIRKRIENQDSDIHFVSSGTQANLIIISSILKPYESVISANTGHINIYEAGATEATGHKINIVDTKNGKLTPKSIQPIIDFHEDEHMVRSEEHTSELQSHSFISYAVFCLKKKKYRSITYVQYLT